MPKPLRLVVTGAAGRMGRRLAALAAADGRFAVAALVDRREDAGLVKPDRLPKALAQADVLVDFSAPEAAVRFASQAAAARKPAVIGVTGFSPVQLAQLKAASRRIPVFLSPNFSPGVHALGVVLRAAASLLKDYEVSISETHHSRKKDAPSGTALRLARILMEARRGAAPAIVSQRVGDVVGDHTVTLAGPCERLELTHRAQSRDVFARGALRAALWVRGRRPGLYDMTDLLADG
ncbi:MAG: dihydrodipicolinate reductase C-terminal domain-containing protein [Elusimicrobia bacterium]|nr:dihydrodipicolinate reductase C-terminal domain-containing protein [Elusimicrobiota bacterium]